MQVSMFIRIVFFFFIVTSSAFAEPRSLYLSPQEAQSIAAKIYQNECSRNPQALLSWNDGEDFLSLGIGHFIWYPEGKVGVFQERFPLFIAFCQDKSASVPTWLEKRPACPWASKKAFLENMSSPQVRELRQFMLETQVLQTEFMIERLKKALPSIAAGRGIPTEQFWRVASSAQGLYALVDYVNFKGEGTNPLERYNGHGWGLLQVLEAMNRTDNPLADFAQAAKATLTKRVANAPKERNEQRWLNGWLNRIATYSC